MPSDYRFWLKNARAAAGLTQEQAAERSCVSIESWRAYEYGTRLPPPETAALIAEALDAEWLNLPLARIMLEPLGLLTDETPPQGLPTATLKLINCVFAFADNHRDRALMRIAQDGVIDEDELPEFEQISAELGEIVGAALAVKYAPKKRAPTLARRSSGARTSGKGANDRKTMIAHREEKSNRNLAARGGVSR